MSTPPSITTFRPWTQTETQVGIRDFDQEHRTLALLIEQLHAAAIVKRDRGQAERLFAQIVQGTRAHFVHEEEVMQLHNYPGLAEHTEQHTGLLKELQDMQRAYLSGTLSALLLTRFLQSWLVDHIRDSDRKYAPYMQRLGVN